MEENENTDLTFLLDELAKEFPTGVDFATLNPTNNRRGLYELIQSEGIARLPETIFYQDGRRVDGSVPGFDSNRMKDYIRRALVTNKKFSQNSSSKSASSKVAAENDPARNAPQAQAPKYKVKTNINGPKDQEDDPDDDIDFSDGEVWAALEEACAGLGYTKEKLRDMLMDTANFPPPALMEIIRGKLGCKDDKKIKPMLQAQRKKVLTIVNKAIEEDKRVMEEEEKKAQDKIRAMGLCPMGFKWHREGTGWRCGGGSHFVTDEQLNAEYCFDVNK